MELRAVAAPRPGLLDVRRPSSPRRAAFALAALALALPLAGCHRKPSAATQRGLSDWLAECSPFSTADSGKTMAFDYDGSVALDRGSNRAAWDRTLPEHVAGRWGGLEAGSHLEIDLPGQAPIRYQLQKFAGRTCLLTATAAPVVDLRTVWFGFVREPDGEDDEEDP